MRWRSGERLARDNPSVTEFQRDLARSHVNFGNRLNDMGNAALALDAFRSARAIGERIARDNPTITGVPAGAGRKSQRHRHGALQHRSSDPGHGIVPAVSGDLGAADAR